MNCSDYQLRYAAGRYWLLNIRQRGFCYIRPLALNECGTQIWRMLRGGADRAQIADGLCEKYGLAREEALRDVESFLQQLNAHCAADRPASTAKF